MWEPLIVCYNETLPQYNHPCEFADLIVLVTNLITNLVIISTFLATAVFAYAGFLLLTSGGNESAKTKAKEMLGKVLRGYLWILCAWVLVYTIFNVLVDTDTIPSLLG